MMGAPGRCRIDPAHLCLNSSPGGDDDDGGGGDDGGACGGDGDGADTTTSNRNFGGGGGGDDGDDGGDRKRALHSDFWYCPVDWQQLRPRLRPSKAWRHLEWDQAILQMTALWEEPWRWSERELLGQC